MNTTNEFVDVYRRPTTTTAELGKTSDTKTRRLRGALVPSCYKENKFYSCKMSEGSVSCFTDFTGVENASITKEEKEEIATRESKAIFRLRIAVLFTLLASTVVVSCAINYYLRNSETIEFQNSFGNEAEKLLKAVGRIIDGTLGASDAFIVKIVTYARNSNSSWPFVTMPYFALHATKVLRLSKGIHLSVKHIVSEGQRSQWEEYTKRHYNTWIQESLDVQEQLDDWLYPIIREFNVSSGIVTPTGLPIEKATDHYKNSYLPMWQQAPMMTGPGNPIPFNMDVFFLPQNVPGSLKTIQSKQIAMGETFWGIISNFSDPFELYIQDLAAKWGANFIPPDESPHEPSFQLNFPVIDAVDSVHVNRNDTSEKVVAVMTFTYYFRSFLRDILPPTTTGIVVVVENACGNQTFSYLLEGPNTIYLGQEDFHDENYDHLVHQATIDQLLLSTQDESQYTGLPLAPNWCPKTLKVYASREFEESFRTIKPALFTCLSVFIFVFSSSIFIFYDWYVDRRQRLVLGQAKASGAIVSSLFPEAYHERLMKANEISTNDNNVTNERNLRKLLERYTNDQDQQQTDQKEDQTMDPIADLYPNCTVFFADIVVSCVGEYFELAVVPNC